MSYITDVIIYDATAKDVEALNAWLLEHDTERGQQLRDVSEALEDAVGGTKFFTTPTWAAAFNHLPDGFVEMLRDPATWHAPTAVLIGLENEPYVEAYAFTWGHEGEGVVRVDST